MTHFFGHKLYVPIILFRVSWFADKKKCWKVAESKRFNYEFINTMSLLQNEFIIYYHYSYEHKNWHKTECELKQVFSMQQCKTIFGRSVSVVFIKTILCFVSPAIGAFSLFDSLPLFLQFHLSWSPEISHKEFLCVFQISFCHLH